MGHRANLVLVNETGYELYYCHWCASDIPRDVFWGPQYALPYIRQQKAVEPDDWMNQPRSVGGVLLDPGKQILLLYGGEDLRIDIPQRRLYLELLRIVWSGWDVRWAYDGIADLGAYVGRDRRAFYSQRKSDRPPAGELHPPLPHDHFVSEVGSFVLEDQQMLVFPLTGLCASDTLRYGPRLIDIAHSAQSNTEHSLHKRLESSHFPIAGFHVEVPQQRLIYWGARDYDSEEFFIKERWPGWTVEWLRDNYEAHLALLDGRVTFPQQKPDILLIYLERMLMYEPFNHVDRVLNTVSGLTKQGHTVEINSEALREDPQQISPERRRAIFDQALAQWRAGRGRST